jgi:hypothetical protein
VCSLCESYYMARSGTILGKIKADVFDGPEGPLMRLSGDNEEWFLEIQHARELMRDLEWELQKLTAGRPSGPVPVGPRR